MENLKTHFLMNMLVFSLGVFNASCKTHHNDSKSEGYFEGNDNKNSLDSVAGSQLRVMAEYESTKTIILSSELIRDSNFINKKDFLDQLLSTGLRKIVVITPNGFLGSMQKRLSSPNIQIIANGKISNDADIMSAWTRDYAPFFAIDQHDLNTIYLLDLNYLGHDPKIADAVPQILEANASVFYPEKKVKRIGLPFALEGGAFMIDRLGNCIISSVTEFRTKRTTKNAEDISPEQINEYLERFFGCKQIIMTGPMPNEATHHVDLFAKFVDDGKVLLAQINPNDMAALHARADKLRSKGTLSEYELNYLNTMEKSYQEIQAFLYKTQQLLNDKNIETETISLPIEHPYALNLTFGYANSLIVNVNGKKTAFIPSFSKASWSSFTENQRNALNEDSQSLMHPLKSLLFSQEELEKKDFFLDKESAVKSIYQSLGFDVKFIPAIDLIPNYGLIHCTTMQVPDF